jgi:selenocysteine lyase/cysteine desulfurase
MQTSLYLDTARLGRMTPGAQRACRDFVSLAGDEGGSPLFELFLREGARAWPADLQSRFPGLAAWRGVGPLKQSLRSLAGGRPDLPVLLAARSAQLMKLAARLLFRPCRNVLVTDLGWPGYHEILEAERRRASRMVTVAAVREAVFRDRAAGEDVEALIVAEAARSRCDGLFLPAVSSDGVRLPAGRIARAVEARQEVRFTVIDGAQEFCHGAAELRTEYCDLYLAGCHKWLGAYHPLGVAFYGRRRSRLVVETVAAGLLGDGDLDDPLLRFTARLEGGAACGTDETVNLAPLFSCQGAAADALAEPGGAAGSFSTRTENLRATAGLANGAGWRPLLADPTLRSGILLVRAERASTREAEPEALRLAFQEQGVALTAYPGGLVRLSMPSVPLNAEGLSRLGLALERVA